MNRAQEAHMLQLSRDMHFAGVNVNCISQTSRMLIAQDDHWVRVWLYYKGRLMGSETMDTRNPYKEEIETVQRRAKIRFGVEVSIAHERL